MRRRSIATLIAVMVCAGIPLAASPSYAWSSGPCTGTSGVSVVVDYGELGGGVVVRCANVSSGATVLQATQKAGFSLTGAGSWGLAFVCRIDGAPPASKALPVSGNSGYRELCLDTPPASAYWSSWSASSNGAWEYSSTGATNRDARIGGFEGWRFTLNGERSAPNATTSRAKAQSDTRSQSNGSKDTAAQPQTSKDSPKKSGTTPRSGSVGAVAAPTTSSGGSPSAPSTSPTASMTNQQATPESTNASSNVVNANAAQSPSGMSMGTLVALVVIVFLIAAAATVAWRRRNRT